MSIVAEKVTAAFESLPAHEQQAVAKEIFRRLPPFDSGSLDDGDIALAGDQLATMLAGEENGSPTR